MSRWTYLRRFLVLQALLLWQGGFLFYAGFVVPIGTEIHGSFGQGLVTNRVAYTLNIIGVVSLLLFGWELFTNHVRPLNRIRWCIWFVWLVTQSTLLVLLGSLREFLASYEGSENISAYQDFRYWHGVYLWVWALQWFLGVCYLPLIIRDWFGNSLRNNNV